MRHPVSIGAVKGCRSEWKVVCTWLVGVAAVHSAIQFFSTGSASPPDDSILQIGTIHFDIEPEVEPLVHYLRPLPHPVTSVRSRPTCERGAGPTSGHAQLRRQVPVALARARAMCDPAPPSSGRAFSPESACDPDAEAVRSRSAVSPQYIYGYEVVRCDGTGLPRLTNNPGNRHTKFHIRPNHLRQRELLEYNHRLWAKQYVPR